MSSTTLAAVCLLSIAASILFAYRFRLNTGLLAIIFTYGIGCFLMDLSVGEVISLFPVKILFLLFSVCLFYGYAIDNGTLQIIADNIIYLFRSHTRMLPFVLYFLAFLLALLGASAPAVSSFLAPVCIAIGAKTGIHYLIMVVLVSQGACAGSSIPWGQGGLIIRGIVESTSYADQASSIALKVCINHFFTGLICLFLVYFALKGYRAKPCHMEKPRSFNQVQKKTLIVLLTVLFFVLVPTLLDTFYPGSVFARVSKLFDIQMLSIIGAVICALLKLGSEREILARYVPWNTIVMVCGICMLLGVTGKTGIFDAISSQIDAGMHGFLISCIFVLIAGFMSFFTGALTVVTPMFLPVALSISAAAGLSPSALASAVVIGATITAISPFSSGGSFILSCMRDEKLQAQMFNKQIILTFLLWLVPIILSGSGFFGLL